MFLYQVVNVNHNIYHYHSDGKAELDVVIQTRKGKIIPIEIVKEDFNSKSKSMGLALNKYNIDFAIRFTSDNFKVKNNIKYVLTEEEKNEYIDCWCHIGHRKGSFGEICRDGEFCGGYWSSATAIG